MANIRFTYPRKRNVTRTPAMSTRIHTPSVPAVKAVPGGVSSGGKLIPATPAIPATPSITTYENEPSQTEFSPPPSTFKVPITVVFMTGFALIIVNNINNGKVTQLWNMVYDGKPIDNPKPIFMTLGGELLFVVIMSFIAEVNGDISGVVFALFVGLWLVWSINNADTIAKWFNQPQGAATSSGLGGPSKTVPTQNNGRMQ